MILKEPKVGGAWTWRKPWVTDCLRELSREAAAANFELLSPLRG
jgi:hypothetical protein